MYYLEIKNISKNYTRIISFETEYQRKRYLDKIKYVNEIVVLDYGRLVSEKMKDYEQMYYDLLYEYKQALKKIDDLEQQMEILIKCKDMKIRKILVEQLINFKKKELIKKKGL